VSGESKTKGFFSPRRSALVFLLVSLFVPLLVSCGTRLGRSNQTDGGKTEKGAFTRDCEYQLGDVRLEGGIEYIYVKNRKFGSTPYERECEWVRKDEYSPRLFEGLANRIMSRSEKKEIEEIEKRIARLEAEVKGGAPAPESPPLKTVSLPAPAAPVPAPAGADSTPKRRVLVLPVKDEKGPGEGHFNDLATMRLVSVLEQTGAVICRDPHSVGLTKDPPTGEAMEALARQGVQAIIRAVIEVQESAFLRVSVDIYDTETTKLLHRLSARSPLPGNMPEKDLVKAVDHTINLLKDDLAGAIRSLDWHGRVASIDKGGTVLNAGRLSGIKEGDVLGVYGRGEQVVDRVTGLPLGRLKGKYKGEIEVLEIFGVDASWARTLKGGPFLPADLVYLKK
jgi:hypothetical protein